jgi:outer membrane protein TolC
MRRSTMLLLLLATVTATRATAAPLTADEAVKLALQHNSQIVQAQAGRYTARSGMWSAYSGLLPNAAASHTRSGSTTDKSTTTGNVGNTPYGMSTTSSSYDRRAYSTTTSVSGSWGIVDLSAWTSWSAARQGVRAADLSLAAARASVAFSTRRQFYTVVQSMHLAVVNAQALHVARDSERRVRAMYEVGSVSKSDLLNAQVTTSQAQLDSLTSANDVTVQRILLAQQLGLPEAQLAEVDSALTVAARPVDAAAVLAEARQHRPDILAAEADAKSATLDLRAARWARLPFVSLNGAWTPKSTSYQAGSPNQDGSGSLYQTTENEKGFSGSAAVNLPIFDGLITDSRVAAARARAMQARETRDALVRNLEGEVHQAVLGYQEAIERIELATRTVESASENQNLVQQKYNVGSATILDLINSQVQLQRAQSSLVSAKAAVRIAEAQLDQVRGLTQ